MRQGHFELVATKQRDPDRKALRGWWEIGFRVVKTKGRGAEMSVSKRLFTVRCEWSAVMRVHAAVLAALRKRIRVL